MHYSCHFGMNMIEITPRQQKIVEIVKEDSSISFGQIFKEFTEGTSERTIKRDITELVAKDCMLVTGGGRLVVYEISPIGRFFAAINAEQYNSVELDKRKGVLDSYVFSIWKDMPNALFEDKEIAALSCAN